MLKPISIGWVWLERTLNGIIEAVNAQHVIPSASVAVQEAPNGVILTVAKGAGGGGGSDGGSWTTVTIVDPTTCAQSQLQVWSKPAGT